MISTPLLVLVCLLVGIDVSLRGLGLWKSARRGQTVWFVAMLLVSSTGIVPAVYLTWFSKRLVR